jgi:hypothetical protein
LVGAVVVAVAGLGQLERKVVVELVAVVVELVGVVVRGLFLEDAGNVRVLVVGVGEGLRSGFSSGTTKFFLRIIKFLLEFFKLLIFTRILFNNNVRSI